MIDQWGVGHEPSPNSMHMTYMRHPLENAETLEELEAYPYPDFAGGSRDHQKEQVRRVKEQDLFSRNDRHADRDAARHAGRSEERSVETEVPLENVLAYVEACREYGGKKK